MIPDYKQQNNTLRCALAQIITTANNGLWEANFGKVGDEPVNKTRDCDSPCDSPLVQPALAQAETQPETCKTDDDLELESIAKDFYKAWVKRPYKGAFAQSTWDIEWDLLDKESKDSFLAVAQHHLERMAALRSHPMEQPEACQTGEDLDIDVALALTCLHSQSCLKLIEFNQIVTTIRQLQSSNAELRKVVDDAHIAITQCQVCVSFAAEYKVEEANGRCMANQAFLAKALSEHALAAIAKVKDKE